MITGLISNNDVFNGIFSQAGLEEKMPILLERFPQFKRPEIRMIAESDPTPSKKYIAWLLKLTAKKNLRFPEDREKVFERLTQFDQLKRKQSFQGERDINQYRTYGNLARTIKNNLSVKTKGEEHREQLTSGMEEIYGDGEYRVIKITTPEASAKLCRGTEWCTKDPKYSNSYLLQGPMYRFEKNGKPIALLHFESEQLMDVYDNSLVDDGFSPDDPETFDEDLLDTIMYLGDKIGKKNKIFDMKFNTIFSHNKDYLSIQAFQDNKELFFQDPLMAYELLKSYRYSPPGMKYINPYIKQLENIIAQSSATAAKYAMNILKQRWSEGEDIISKDTTYAKTYHRYFFDDNERWPEAEDTLAKSFAYGDEFASGIEYARDAIKGAWPAFEKELINFKRNANNFQISIIRNYLVQIVGISNQISEIMFNYINSDRPFENNQETNTITEIITLSIQTGIQFPYIEEKYITPANIEVSYIINTYCKRMKKEWNADLSRIEENIKNNPFGSVMYAKEVLNYNRFPEAEPAIINEFRNPTTEATALAAVDYLMSIVKGPWPEAEDSIMNSPNEELKKYYLGLVNKQQPRNRYEPLEEQEENSDDFQEII